MKRFALGVLALVATAAVAGEPYVPENEDAVLARVPPAQVPGTQALRRLRVRLDRAPRDPALAARYAHAAIEQARTTGDPRYTGNAKGALSPWWDQAEPPLRIRVLRATIRQRRHQFEWALQDLDAVIEQRP